MSKQNPVAMKWLLICSKDKWSAGPLGLFGTFTELALFVFQACTLAPAPPITAPPWSSSPRPQTPPPPPPPLTCPPDNTDWTGTLAALTTCPHWLPWMAQETGESSVSHGCIQLWRCVILTLTLTVTVEGGEIINVPEGWEI